MTTSKDLPALIEGSNDIKTYTEQGKFKELLNQQPNKAWVKDHPIAKNVKYLPIDKVETMLDMIFQQWKIEIKSVNQLAQSICAVVRLHYLNPITNEWSYHDGVGATPLKTDKGASAAELGAIKNDAVATGAPSAVSFAIKDAAEHLGKLFGRDLNRKDTIAFTNLFVEDVPEYDKEGAMNAMKEAKTIDELRQVWNNMPAALKQDGYLKVLKEDMKTKLGDANEGSAA